MYSVIVKNVKKVQFLVMYEIKNGIFILLNILTSSDSSPKVERTSNNIADV